ncbi:hypothetical protein [Yoonia sediminilitoris]|uniref:Uncharacterized protein n=1 Tax=Yoonia sediminilitoris TaxID=1286148 RepID=A0A2T6KBZ9_9RHOB|nr:hypothetical protein [Yoonia sediminilitoris]PUB12388.1 hypothetical protein C8N45_11027 [Yoonia sediminilitoris]RCW93082.1 hypothetical protein DFP92_11027 [Yoonia sediminilitoris]
MTDMPETHTASSFTWSVPRATLLAVLEVAKMPRMAAVAYLQGPKFTDPRPLAERIQQAETLREEARRKVDRLMM